MICCFTAILKQTKREWRKRKEILQSMLDECAREIPLSELEQLTQDQHSASSQAPRERSYDVDKLYAQYEDELNKARRRAIGPEAYGMLETDVNLRKYRIIGGVYCIDFLETPQQDKQLNARSFIRTGNSSIKVVSGDLLHPNWFSFPCSCRRQQSDAQGVLSDIQATATCAARSATSARGDRG